MYLDKDAILQSLTKDDIISLLKELGSPEYRLGKKGELIFKAVCHGGESYKLYYYHEKTDSYPAQIFHCYSGCHDSFGCIELVIRVKRQHNINLTFFQALNFIATITNKIIYSSPIVGDEAYQIEDWNWINRLKAANNKANRSIPTLPEYNEHILELFNNLPYQGWLDEGITRSALTDFEIGYDCQHQVITIPHRDINGRFVGLRGRFLLPDDILKGKYRPLYIEGNCLAHELGNTFYGIYQNRAKIMQSKKVLLIEGEKSCLLNHGYFGVDDFSLATCGSNLTAIQIKILLQLLHVEEVILGYDKMFHDPESIEATLYRNQLYTKIAPLIPYCKVSILWDDLGLTEYKSSPCDYGKETLLTLLDNKKVITTTDLVVLQDKIDKTQVEI